MQRSEVVSLPIISLNDGKYLGKIKQPILDPHNNSVIGFVAGEKTFFPSKSQGIQMDSVRTIGRYAVTVSESNMIKTLEDLNLADYINITPLDKKIITSNGEFFGNCKDYTFSFPGGQLDSLLVSDPQTGELHYLPFDQVLTLGKDYIITTGQGKRPALLEKTPEPQYDPRQQNDTKGITFALGNEAKFTVEDSQGGIIIREGEIITPEVIDLAKASNQLPQVLLAAGIEDTPFDFEQEPDMSSESGEEPDMWNHWQQKLKETLENASGDIETKLRRYLIGRKPAYTVVNHQDKLLKVEGDIITQPDLDQITNRKDLMKLVSATTASDIDQFMTSLENQLKDQVFLKSNRKNLFPSRT